MQPAYATVSGGRTWNDVMAAILDVWCCQSILIY